MNESVVQGPDKGILVEEVQLSRGIRFGLLGAQIVATPRRIGRRVTHLHIAWLALALLVVVPGLTLLAPKALLRKNRLVEELDGATMAASWK